MKIEERKLGELVVNFDRKRIPLSSRQRAERKGIYPYYGATSVMDYVDDYIFEGKYLLMGEDGTVIDEKGKPILQIANGKFWCNNHAHVLQNTDLVTFDYLYYLLKNTYALLLFFALFTKMNKNVNYAYQYLSNTETSFFILFAVFSHSAHSLLTFFLQSAYIPVTFLCCIYERHRKEQHRQAQRRAEVKQQQQ